MDAFVSRKKRRVDDGPREESTEMKLALLLSMHPDMSHEELLDALVLCDGSVENASSSIEVQKEMPKPAKKTAPPAPARPPPKKRSAPSVQSSLLAHVVTKPRPTTASPTKHTKGKKAGPPPPPKKGQTIHLYTPDSIALHTPCTLIPNYLPPAQATTLLGELLAESTHFSRAKFQLFDRTVQSPHSASVYVSTPEEYHQQTAEYTYGGTYRSNVRQVTPCMRAVSAKVQESVNEEIRRRIREVYPGGRKLRFQSDRPWRPNAAFVNCYDGPAESVGFHSDELTYLGPRPVIGSLSLGVEREFRVRRIAPRAACTRQEDDYDDGDGHGHDHKGKDEYEEQDADENEGQISIHLPHNSLLIMHAEMQEEWKHAIVPAQTISPHPVSGNRRINITYRWYRDSLHPRYTPRCRCGVSAVLRCAQRKRESRGRYMWMCYAGYAPGKKSCSFFQWAEFDDNGEPLWTKSTEDSGPVLSNFVASQSSLSSSSQEKSNTTTQHNK